MKTVRCIIKMSSLDYLTGDAQVKALSSDARAKGATRYPHEECTVYEIYSQFLPLDNAKFLVANEHGDVEDFPLAIKVSDLDELVPIGVEGWSVEGEHLTWSQWVKPNTDPINGGDGFFYINTACCHSYEEYLPLSKMLPIFDKLVTIQEIPTNNLNES